MIPLPDAAGFILAGGRSSRMGTDKALVLFEGQPLVQVALRAFVEAGIPARIAGSRSGLSTFAEEIPDTFQGSGPLGGVHAALAASNAPWNLFLPVDMPLMPSSLLRCLVERARLTDAPITAAKLNGSLQPFPVVLSRSVLGFVEQRLQIGQTACHLAWKTISAELESSLDAVSVESLIQCGQCSHSAGLLPVFWFQSANTPAELLHLSHWSQRFGRP